MKTIKLCIGAMLSIVLQVKAQKIADVKIITGANFTNVKYMLNGQQQDRSGAIGYVLGAMASIKHNDFLGIQPSLFLTKKGASYYHGYSSNDLKTTSRINYVEISVPINLSFSEDNSNSGLSWGLYTGLGPYIAMATGAKAKIKDMDLNVRTEKMSVGNGNNAHVRGFDTGLVWNIGFTLDYIVVHLQTEWGMANINPSHYNGTIKNRSTMLTLGLNIK